MRPCRDRPPRQISTTACATGQPWALPPCSDRERISRSPAPIRPACGTSSGWCIGLIGFTGYFGVDRDLHVVPDQHAAGFKSGVPVESEILAVNARLGGGATPEKTPRILKLRREVLDRELHRARDAVDGEI